MGAIPRQRREPCVLGGFGGTGRKFSGRDKLSHWEEAHDPVQVRNRKCPFRRCCTSRGFVDNLSLRAWLLDGGVLLASFITVIGIGLYKGRGDKTMEGFAVGNRSIPWWAVGVLSETRDASSLRILHLA